MEGSEAPEPVAVCDVAGPHSKIVDTTATAEGVTKLDDTLMTNVLPKAETPPQCVCTSLHIAEISQPGY
jgi:hypothetical protein